MRSIKHRAYIVKNVNKLPSVCKLKVIHVKPLSCRGDCGEVHVDMKLKRTKRGKFKVLYSFDNRSFKEVKPDKALSRIKSAKVAFDIKVPKSLRKKKTVKLKLKIIYDETAFKIKHFDAHEMH